MSSGARRPILVATKNASPGAKLTPARYEQAKTNLAAARATLDRIFDDYDALLTPSLGGEAPVGLTEVRTSTFNRLWTHMYTPAVNLPLFEGPPAMPVGIQIVAPPWREDVALAVASFGEKSLGGFQPPGDLS